MHEIIWPFYCVCVFVFFFGGVGGGGLLEGK